MPAASRADAAGCCAPDNAADSRRAGCIAGAAACVIRSYHRASAKQGSSQDTTGNDDAPVRENETTMLGWA